MLPQQTPPITETGVIKWLRENLFSSWLNAILTVLALWAVWWVAAHVLPWAVYGIWNAASLNECRAIRDELYGPGTSVACWAVITRTLEPASLRLLPAAVLLAPRPGARGLPPRRGARSVQRCAEAAPLPDRRGAVPLLLAPLGRLDLVAHRRCGRFRRGLPRLPAAYPGRRQPPRRHRRHPRAAPLLALRCGTRLRAPSMPSCPSA